jgi:hypothetical protein
MNEPLSWTIEHSLQIALDYLERSGELGDAAEASRSLLGTVDALVLQGERRKIMLANRAIEAYRRHKQKLVA